MTAFSPETLMLAAFVLPLAAAVLIPLLHHKPDARDGLTIVAAALVTLAVWQLAPQIAAGARPVLKLAEPIPGLALAFKLEPLGMIFALVAGTLWLLSSIYAIGYMRGNGEPRQTSFYVCFAIAIAATMGIAFSANLLTLFLFYEALTLSTYPLVTHKRTPEAIRAGRIYLGLLIATSMALLLPAIVATSVLAGTLDFAPGGILAGKASPAVLGVLLALFAFGIGKAALMPVHAWLPAAMVAPTPVSALLHAVAVVKAGVFTVLKVVVFVFGLETLQGLAAAQWLLWIAAFTIITASLLALAQDNLKRRLAYSTISQLGYVVLGAALFTPLAALGAAMHIAAHAVAKITLFFAAGSIYTAAHKTEISQLDGIGWRMPWTMGAFAIGALAMIGLPPTAGFLGKWFMLQGALAVESWLAIAVIAVSTVLNALYFLPIVYRAFLLPEADGEHASEHGEAPWPIVLALTATAAMTVVLFLYPDPLFALAREMIKVAP